MSFSGQKTSWADDVDEFGMSYYYLLLSFIYLLFSRATIRASFKKAGRTNDIS